MLLNDSGRRAVVDLVKAFLDRDFQGFKWNVGFICDAENLIQIWPGHHDASSTTPVAFRWPVDAKTIKAGVERFVTAALYWQKRESDRRIADQKLHDARVAYTEERERIRIEAMRPAQSYDAAMQSRWDEYHRRRGENTDAELRANFKAMAAGNTVAERVIENENTPASAVIDALRAAAINAKAVGPVTLQEAPDSSLVACMKSTVAEAVKSGSVMARAGKANHHEDKQEPHYRKVKQRAGLQVAGKRTTGVNRWVELDIEGSDLLFDEPDEFRLSDEMASVGDRIRAAYTRSCSDRPWSRQGMFLGDDLDMTFSDAKNGLSFYGTDRSGHSGRVSHAR